MKAINKATIAAFLGAAIAISPVEAFSPPESGPSIINDLQSCKQDDRKAVIKAYLTGYSLELSQNGQLLHSSFGVNIPMAMGKVAASFCKTAKLPQLKYEERTIGATYSCEGWHGQTASAKMGLFGSTVKTGSNEYSGAIPFVIAKKRAQSFCLNNG